MTAHQPQISATAAPAARSVPVCPECGGPVAQTGKGKARVFCKEEHRQAHANRRAVRGKAIMSLLQAWRVDRGKTATAKDSFAAAVQMLDEFNAEDFELGRARANVHAAELLKQGDYRDRRSVHLDCTKGYQGCERRTRPGFNCGSLADARRHARTDGWLVEPGQEVCPNCRDDIRVVAR